MKGLKIIIEKHSDCYVAYPRGLHGAVVGQGDTYEEAISDVKSAIVFHTKTFGSSVWENKSDVLEAFVAEIRITA